MGHTMLMNQ